MKGQFFILGSVLIVALMASAIAIRVPLIAPFSDDMVIYSSSIENEMPRALNFGLETGTPAATLANFTQFINNTLEQHSINFSSVWVISLGDGTPTLNLVVGNFMRSSQDITLEIDGDVRVLSISPGQTGSEAYIIPIQNFNLTVQFGDKNETLEWNRDKTNLYTYFLLERDRVIIQEEFNY